MTPDDMKDKETQNPSGTAGINYNETPSLKLTGYINSNNYTNFLFYCISLLCIYINNKRKRIC